MARPEKHNADYFSHDKDMRNDPKVKALRKKFKDGYSVWNMLLELLTATDFFVLELTPLNYELMAGDFDVEAEILEQIVAYCIKIELLKCEENKIYSCGLKKRLQPVIDKRNNVKQKFLQQKLNEEDVSSIQNTQSKVKYSKVKEIKNIVVEEDAAEAEIFEEKIEEIQNEELESLPAEFSLNEEEFFAAEKFLKSHSIFGLVQMQHKLDEKECLVFFRVFFEQKSAFGELVNKKPLDVMKHFYSWVPKYKRAQSETKTKQFNSKPSSNRFDKLQETFNSVQNPYLTNGTSAV